MAIWFSPIWSPKLVQAVRPTRMPWLCPMGVIRGPGFWPSYARDRLPEGALAIRLVCGRSPAERVPPTGRLELAWYKWILFRGLLLCTFWILLIL